MSDSDITVPLYIGCIVQWARVEKPSGGGHCFCGVWGTSVKLFSLYGLYHGIYEIIAKQSQYDFVEALYKISLNHSTTVSLGTISISH